MLPFSLFAPAKINLALHVLGRREDGYHDLDSIVAFADTGDWLTFSAAPSFAIESGGPFAGDLPEPGGNIIARAWETASRIAAARGMPLPPVKVYLEKNLPVASGIGGGSANAAAALRGFLRIAGIEGCDDAVMQAALKLGADVPVCLNGRACRMRGIGERITAIEPFAARHAILVNPRVVVSTPAVFAQLGLQRGQCYEEPIIHPGDEVAWRNDLTPAAMVLAPVIGEVLAKLETLPGVTRAFMSGSGATCVALIDRGFAGLPANHGWWWARTIIS